MGQNRNRAKVGQRKPEPSNQLLSDIHGIVLLLMSAKTSLQINNPGNGCVDGLTLCISRLQDRYLFDENDSSEQMADTNASLPAILRLLSYVREELCQKLNDRECAEELKFCIDHLTRAIGLPRDYIV
jgi:hypothetical protein